MKIKNTISTMDAPVALSLFVNFIKLTRPFNSVLFGVLSFVATPTFHFIYSLQIDNKLIFFITKGGLL